MFSSAIIPVEAGTFISFVEGELSNRKNDRGGLTYAGLTAPALAKIYDSNGTLLFDFDKDGDVDSADILALSKFPKTQRDALVASFYERLWVESGASKLPWPFSLVVFDGATHSGPTTGVVLFQQALAASQSLEIRIDGLVGPKTIEAAKNTDVLVFSRFYAFNRLKFWLGICRSRPNQVEFLHGWCNRLAHLCFVIESSLEKAK